MATSKPYAGTLSNGQRYLICTTTADTGGKRYIQALLGYSCSGDVGEHILPICYGSGANGKSTLWNAIVELLGDYAMLAPSKLLLGTTNEHDTVIASLYQRRLVAISEPDGRVSRISRLLALAHHCFQLVQTGAIINQSELAHFGQISTTRMTQIMWLDNLAPDIQEEILFLPRTTQGRDAIKEADIRPIAKTLDWHKQRQMWKQMKTTVPPQSVV